MPNNLAVIAQRGVIFLGLALRIWIEKMSPPAATSRRNEVPLGFRLFWGRGARATVAPAMRVAEIARRREWGRGFRTAPSRVHQVLDDMGWTLGELAQRVGKILGRDISRSSMQFYAAGERATWAKGVRGRAPTSAPHDVRQAAKRATQGRLQLTDWPDAPANDT